MKIQEIREMSDEDLKTRETELIEQIFRGRFKKSLGEVDAVKGVRLQKKELAQVKTIARERVLAIKH
ncbi:MAG: 50S ribosomal protein L29 [Blastocatellia bacterium]|nr:50S ribosomal protein L29 [Blastocatellia bacterium]MBL8193002.1 50S ribosomal protein L29 [Blastocatellia bacterium]MBN8723227.1 50S ribosomal protein L29 [Acidobacteriota bacterium]